MIEQTTIDKIFDTANIVDVISDFVTLKKRGVNYIGLCPFHNEKTPSFTVSQTKGIYKCFGCGKAGNSIGFIIEHEKMSFVEAIKYLGAKYHIEIIEKEQTPEEKEKIDERESLLVVTEYAKNYFANILNNNTDGKTIGLSYLKAAVPDIKHNPDVLNFLGGFAEWGFFSRLFFNQFSNDFDSIGLVFCGYFKGVCTGA